MGDKFKTRINDSDIHRISVPELRSESNSGQLQNMGNLGFMRICVSVGEAAHVRDAHFFQRVESGARGGIQGIGREERYYLLAQQSSLHHPTDAPIENRPARFEKLQLGECEK